MADPYFTKATFDFLQSLSRNNQRDWFMQNKSHYEMRVREPALRFISAMADKMPDFAPQFVASAEKVGGSLMRVHRDTRFSKDKTPYKTNIGIQFRHNTGKDVHAPGYYLHISPEECFLGAGIWHPEPDILLKIRQAIVEKEKAWQRARDDKVFRKNFVFSGDSLQRVPRGFPSDHVHVTDLMRKDFIGVASLSRKLVTSAELLPGVVKQFTAATPLMKFLCQALELKF